MTRTLSLLFCLVAAPLAAQEPAHSRLETRAQTEDDDGGLLSTRSLLHTLGGAVVGGWVGYVGAQVARSDWDKEHNGSFSGQRSAWAAVGAIAGMIGVHLLGTTSPPREPGPFVVERAPTEGRDNLSREEIEESGGLTVYEVIRGARPHWLEDRGAKSWNDHGNRSGVIVYLDGAKLGYVDAMRELPREILLSARYLDATRATYKFGHGHEDGAIELSTRESASR